MSIVPKTAQLLRVLLGACCMPATTERLAPLLVSPLEADTGSWAQDGKLAHV